VDVHLYRARADEQGAADLPAGVSLGYQLHDVQFTAGEAITRREYGRRRDVSPSWRSAAVQLSRRWRAPSWPAVACAAGGRSRAGVLAEPGSRGGGAALGLRCLQRQVQAAEHLGCRAQLVCCRLRLVCQQGLAAGVGEGGDRFGLGGGLGYLRQGGGAGAGVGGQALFGEGRDGEGLAWYLQGAGWRLRGLDA
jgi:hypothetical protein